MSRLLYRIGHFSGRHPWRVLATWILVAVAAFVLNGSIGGQPDESFRLPGAESQRAADALQKRFPQETLYTSNVIFHAKIGLTTPEVKAAVARAVTELEKVPHVTGVSDPYDPRGPTLSKDGKTAFATVAFTKNKVDVAQYDAAQKAVQVVRDAGVEVEYDSNMGYAKAAAGPSSEGIGILVAVLVLVVAFGSLVAMSIPIVVALIGLMIGVSGIGITSGVLAVPEIATSWR